jgi:hypothetical protein
MTRFVSIRVCAALSLALALPAPGAASDDPVEDIVGVLRQNGLIDAATEQQILAKRVRQQADRPPAVGSGSGFLEGFVWSGDLRLRNEQFWYDQSFGQEAQDRNRFRYRARIGFTKPVSDSLRIGMRLATGQDFNSTNESFGGNDDFGRDTIAIDQMYAEWTLPGADSGWVSTLSAGKLNNPFLWKNSSDRLVWDPDISPEGLALHTEGTLRGSAKLFATAGYFLVSEESSAKDPKLVALQVGSSVGLAERHELGVRLSGYEWRALDDDTIARSLAGMNPTTGGNLSGAFDDGRARIAEATTYLKLGGLPCGPALLWATGARNLTADPTPPLGDENTAWGAGFEVGDEKELARLAAGYFRIEANAVLSRYADSDLFDGFTNREGFFVSLSRELASRVLLRLTLFDGEEIRTLAVPPGEGDVAREGGRADRKRLQSDIEFKF